MHEGLPIDLSID